MRQPVLGIGVDSRSRCAHYHSARDIVAIRMKCCGQWYACRDCHDALAGHAAEVWPSAERDTRAVLCGACGAELTIRDYLGCADACPMCDTAFNPGCREHHHLYFEV